MRFGITSRNPGEIAILILVLLLTLVALSPLLRVDQPCTHDGGLHYFRIVAMRHSVENGLLASRWVPDLAFGYGYPFFNYRAAVSYYLGLGLFLTGISLPLALNLVYVIALLASALGAYLLGRDLFGRRAGLVAAVAYVYAPYPLIDALVRGNMPESVALAVLPFVLWSFRRLLVSGKTRYVLTSAGSLALLWLSHNISSLLFTPFLLLYLLVVWVARRTSPPPPASPPDGRIEVTVTGDSANVLASPPEGGIGIAVTSDNVNVLASPPEGGIEGGPAPDAASGGRQHLLAALVAFALGIGLTAFFWAPAILEQGQVQLHLSRTTRNNDYHYNFVNLAEVLASPQPADPALLNPSLRLPVGLPLAVLAALGTGLALWRWRPSRARDPEDKTRYRERWATIMLFALSSLVMIFMATRASVLIWENLPLIPFVQFPWRFVGRAVLPMSLLAAAFVAALPGERGAGTVTLAPPPPLIPPSGGEIKQISRPSWLATLLAASVLLVLILAALPFTYPSAGYCPAKAHPNMLDLFAYERTTGLVGVDPEGSYFPVTVAQRPSGSPLEAQYAAMLGGTDRDGGTIARFDPTSLPQGAILYGATYAPNYARLEIETPSAFPARYLTFAFPGWRVSIDDRPVEILPSQPEGLITFEVPPGRHVVEVDWRSTPVRAVATMVSLVALAGVAFLVYTALRDILSHRIQPASATRPASVVPSGDVEPAWVGPGPLSWTQVGLLGLVALLLLAFKLVVVDQTSTPFRRSGLDGQGALPGVDVPTEVRFADGVRLLGYDLSAATMPADGTLHLALYWSADVRPSRSYRSTVTLQGPDGALWSPKNALPRRGYADLPPSPAWGRGHYAVDGMDIEPLPGTPPGQYDLLLTAFDRETLAPLNVLDDAGGILGPNLVVGRVELTRPTRHPDPSELAIQTLMDAAMGPLSLAGVNRDRDEAAPGDPMLITAFWEMAAEEPLPGLTAHLDLMGPDGVVAADWDLPPVRVDWPTPLWRGDDLWRGQHLLRLPGALKSGDYVWQLSLYEGTAPQSRFPDPPVSLGPLRVAAPERHWEAPPLQLSLNVDLGGVARLLGADLDPAGVITQGIQPGTTVTITLAWEALAEMKADYRVFLHLLGPDGVLLVQSDGVPLDWTRPTTGWAPGEVLLDRRVLEIPVDAPPGTYRLLAGLYEPGAGVRLRSAGGGDAVSIAPISIKAP